MSARRLSIVTKRTFRSGGGRFAVALAVGVAVALAVDVGVAVGVEVEVAVPFPFSLHPATITPHKRTRASDAAMLRGPARPCDRRKRLPLPSLAATEDYWRKTRAADTILPEVASMVILPV
jgi:hypothetical protein